MTNGVDSGADGAGDGAAASEPESITETESDLYESGPADIPVTIAKLEAVNVEKISLIYEDVAADLNLSYTVKYSTAKAGKYTVTGIKDAVNMEEATYVMLVNGEETTIENAEIDGSFSLSIAANESDVIAILPLESTQTYGGIPIYGSYSDGVPSLTLTNTDKINVGQNLLIKNSYAYIGTNETDDTYSLYRLHLDGLSVETIATGITSQVRYLSVDNEHNVIFITQDGKIYLSKVNKTSPPSLKYLTATTDTTSWVDPVIVHDFNEDLSDPDNFSPPPIRSFIATNGDIFIAHGRRLRNEGSLQANMLLYINAATHDVTKSIDTATYRSVFADVGSTDSLFLFVNGEFETSEGDMNAKLFELDMLDGEDAWDNRELIYNLPKHEVGDYQNSIVNLTASLNDFLVFVVRLNNDEDFYLKASGLEPEVFMGSSLFGYEKEYSEWVSLSESSRTGNAEVVTCATDLEDETKKNLVIHRIGKDAPGEWYRLTNSSVVSACGGAYSIDEEDRILFYQAFYDGNTQLDPQLSFIDITKLDEDELVPDWE
ncbi:MAG: hypothetical protein ABII18_01965 [bacterium]